MLKLSLFVFVIGLVIIPTIESHGVGGISNTKIIVPSTDTVPQKHIEIEPFFSYTSTDDVLDTESSGFGSRFTLGVLKNMEAGFNLNYLNIEDSDNTDAEYDFGNIEAGIKYRILDQNESLPFSLAFQGGLTFPTGGDDELWFFEPVGLIITRNYNENLSSDLDFVLSFDEDETIGIVSNLGIGYFVSDKFQPVIEASYNYANPEEEDNTHVINGTTGFTAPVNDMLTIIFGVTYDLYSENADDELTVSAAFTFLF